MHGVERKERSGHKSSRSILTKISGLLPTRDTTFQAVARLLKTPQQKAQRAQWLCGVCGYV